VKIFSRYDFDNNSDVLFGKM